MHLIIQLIIPSHWKKWNLMAWLTKILHESYLSDRKQYIQIGEYSKTDLKYITCSVPHGSIVGPLLFLVYVNNLPNASHLLDPIMFADDANLFFNHKDIKHLFTVVNNELDWFTANKLSSNVEIQNAHSSISQVRMTTSLLPKPIINK